MAFDLNGLISRILGNKGVPAGISAIPSTPPAGTPLDDPTPKAEDMALPSPMPVRRAVDQMVDSILKREGGFTIDPDDPGGATKYGITQSTLAKYRGDERISPEDVRSLNKKEARKIYIEDFINKPGFIKLPSVLRENVVDQGVMAGPIQATKLLQRVLKRRGFDPGQVDGILGKNTMKAVEDASRVYGPEQLARDYTAERGRYIQKIIRRNPKLKKFEKGWQSRIDEFLA